MKITDNYIIKLFYTKNGNGLLNSQLRQKLEDESLIIVSKDIDVYIRKYVKTRYNDSKSIRETLFRMKYHIEKRPHCITPGCNNDVEFNGTAKKPYMLHCCCACTQKDNNVRQKNENTCLLQYGVKNGAQSIKSKEKYQRRMEQKYGIGIKNAFQADEIKTKIKQKMLNEYGVDNISKTQQCKDKHKLCEKETVAKRNATKRKNHTFNTSKSEEEAYQMLIKYFGIDNVIRQYSSEKYPFNCDFYVKSYDLYIEFNGSWTHGSHSYDKNSKEDQMIVEKWRSKHTKYYDIAIHTWTIRDINKRNIARQNGINMKEFWKIEKLKEFLKDFKNEKT